MIELLNEAREKWITEQPIYEELARYVDNTLESELRKIGIYTRISNRPKDMAGLLKKVVRKKDEYKDPYADMPDKAGVRVVVHFSWEMKRVDEILYKLFKVVDKDNKSLELGVKSVGYQAIHYQIEFDETKDATAREKFAERQCEIQVRTVCQDVWSEMAHILIYKPEIDVPNDLSRHVHCLSALLEVADKNFAEAEQMIRELPGTYTLGLLSALESHFYDLIGSNYDRKLSLETVDYFKGLYNQEELGQFHTRIGEFVQEHALRLQEAHRLYKDSLVFISQPEMFMIFERLNHDRYMLIDQWCRRFPIEELQEMARAWGTSLD